MLTKHHSSVWLCCCFSSFYTDDTELYACVVFQAEDRISSYITEAVMIVAMLRHCSEGAAQCAFYTTLPCCCLSKKSSFLALCASKCCLLKTEMLIIRHNLDPCSCGFLTNLLHELLQRRFHTWWKDRVTNWNFTRGLVDVPLSKRLTQLIWQLPAPLSSDHSFVLHVTFVPHQEDLGIVPRVRLDLGWPVSR